ncbi:hypothetical protein [Methanosarcina sp.]|jgi:molybdate/tungstate transport system ATP-binding protein|uniref:hypothetical protein n=1 Tax=Methanosarcina sp. TaxID=2213 RepID=UPI002C02BD5D|nr:hypothetical protein [Methanosarcina sp.]HOW13591.1 hypothetical protein [Methanosarcina sp.]
MLKYRIVYADRRFLSIGTGIAIIDASNVAEAGDTVYVFLRPENIALSKTSAQSSIRNSLYGRVTEVGIPGVPVRVKVDCGIILNVLITWQKR